MGSSGELYDVPPEGVFKEPEGPPESCLLSKERARRAFVRCTGPQDIVNETEVGSDDVVFP